MYDQYVKVYNPKGEQVFSGVTIYLEEYEELEDGSIGNLVKRSTSNLNSEGLAVFKSVDEQHYRKIFSDKTTGINYGAGYIPTDGLHTVYITIQTCYEETEHFPSARALLEIYDYDDDGYWDFDGLVEAITHWFFGERCNDAEGYFIMDFGDANLSETNEWIGDVSIDSFCASLKPEDNFNMILLLIGLAIAAIGIWYWSKS